MTDEHRSKLGIDWPTVTAGALAAVTVAVLLSTLGAAGTLVGAAVGSVVASLTTAVYRQGIDTSRRKVAAMQKTALVEVGVAQEEVRRASHATASPTAEADLARAERRLDAALADLESVEPEPVGPEPVEPEPVGPEPVGAGDTRELEVVEDFRPPRWRALPWKRIAVGALGLFIVTVLLIGAFELVTGRSVSSYTGGAGRDRGISLTRLVEDDTDQGRDDRRRPPVDQPADRPTDDPTDPATTPPAEQPTPQQQSTQPAEPSDPVESEQPTQQPTETPPTSEPPTETASPEPTVTP